MDYCLSVRPPPPPHNCLKRQRNRNMRGLGTIALLCAAALVVIAACGGGSSSAVKEFDIDSDTTGQEFFDALSSSEQECIRGELDDEAFERFMEQLAFEDNESGSDTDAFLCLAPETVRGFYFSVVVATYEAELGRLSSKEKSCLRDLVGGLDHTFFTDGIDEDDYERFTSNVRNCLSRLIG